MHESDTLQRDWSRRGFMKGALAVGTAGVALSMSDRLAMAQQLITGGKHSIEAIRGVGVQPGLVRMSLNENPLGPSPRAIEAISKRMFGVNRYGMEMATSCRPCRLLTVWNCRKRITACGVRSSGRLRDPTW